MRCPKCGYISFDHVETCLKCKKNIQSVSENLHGTVFNVTPPVFLKFNSEPDDEPEELDEIFDADDAFEDEEIRDPDLDILLTDEEEEAEGREGVAFEPEEDSGDFELQLGDEEGDEEVDINLEDDQEEEGIAFNFSMDEEEEHDFDDMPGALEEDEEIPAPLPEQELPEELSDMSDLAPPALEEVREDQTASDEDLDLDFNLDLDLDMDDESEPAEEPVSLQTKTQESDVDELSLDDLGLDDEEQEEAKPKKKPASGDMDLDDDLNFDLDLGDLDLDDK